MKDGYSPLFINKKLRMQPNTKYLAEHHPTKGFADREGWHCTLKPIAPHLKEDIDSRVWVKVKLHGPVELYNRPESQGGTWVLCKGYLEILDEI